MTIVHSSKTRKEVFRSLEEAFANESFDEAKLGELITVLGDGVNAKYPPHIIDRLVKLFIKTQGPGYKPSAALVCRLVDLLVRNQSTEHLARGSGWTIAKENKRLRRNGTFSCSITLCYILGNLSQGPPDQYSRTDFHFESNATQIR